MTSPALPESPPRRKLLIDLLVVAALAALGGAGYLLAPLLTPKSDVTLPLSTCDLAQSSCVVALPDGGQVEVTIAPRPIPALKPLQLQAVASGGRVAKVAVDFAGVDMKMGVNRPQLAALGDGRFAGQGNLPVCVTGRMMWEATVIVETAGAVVAAPFRFESAGS